VLTKGFDSAGDKYNGDVNQSNNGNDGIGPVTFAPPAEEVVE